MVKLNALLFGFLLLFGMLFASTNVKAHGTSQSFPKDVGGFTIELEYDSLGVFDDTTMPFVFRLLDQKTKNASSFDSLLVRFEKKSDKSTIIVAKVVPDELQEGVGRVTAMLNSGEYIVSLIFYKKDAKIAETDYELKVEKGEANKKLPMAQILTGVGGIVVGFVLAKLIKSSYAA